MSERRGIPHHLFDALDVTEDAAVAWYQDAARAVIGEIHARGADAILVGGSGLYVSGVVFDFRFPPRDPEVRARLEAELDHHGPGVLFERLKHADPATAARMDPRNGRRIVRALEVLEQGSETHGAALPDEPVLWHPATRLVGVQVPREELIARLDARVEGMWRDGLLAEVEVLRARGLERGVTARRAIGYAQALAQLAGELSEAEAIEQTQQLTQALRAASGVVVPPLRRSAVGGAGASRVPAYRGDAMTIDVRTFAVADTDAASRSGTRWASRAHGTTRTATSSASSRSSPSSSSWPRRRRARRHASWRATTGIAAGSTTSPPRPTGGARASPAHSWPRPSRDCCAMGCPKVQLMVRPENEAARGFYDALGYEPFDTWATGKRLIADEPAAAAS